MKKYNKSTQRKGDKPQHGRNNKNNKRRRNPPKGGTQGRYVKLREGESVDQLIKRFKRVVEASGVMGELKRREFYLSPSQKVRDKKKKALKRLRKRMRAMQRYSKED